MVVFCQIHTSRTISDVSTISKMLMNKERTRNPLISRVDKFCWSPQTRKGLHTLQMTAKKANSTTLSRSVCKTKTAMKK